MWCVVKSKFVPNRLEIDAGALDVERTLLAFTLDKRDDFHLVVERARALGVLALVAPERFVHFNRAAVAAKLAFGLDVHCLADTVRHEPSGFVGHAQSTVQLVTAHALLGRAQQMRRQHPLVQRHLRTFEHRADRHRVLAAAMPAEVQAGTMRRAFKLGLPIRAAAMRADRAPRPAETF